MASGTNNSFPWRSDGIYVFDNAKVDGTPATGGSGEITWSHEDGTPIVGQTWPAPVTWNATLKRFESPIDAACETTLGELVLGERVLTALNGKVARDLVKIRVRALSS